MTLDYFNIQKIRFFLFLITIIISKDAFSQNDNTCDKSWSEWKTVWSSPSGKVEYQLQFFSNGKCSCGLASKYVRIRHTLPQRTYVEIWLEGKDCEDKFMKSNFGAETMNGEISNDKGDWHSFKSISGVEKVLIEYMDGEKKIKIITTRAGTKRFINSIPEEEYNKQQQQKASSSSGSPTNRSGSNKVVPGTALPAIVFPGDETTNSSSNNKNTNQSTSSSSGSQTQAQLAEQQRQRQEEAKRKQQEAERRQREEAFRQNELRYQAQLKEITRKSEVRAQRDASIMQGMGAVFTILQQNEISKGFNEDARKRRKRIDEFNTKSKDPSYELADCNKCSGEGYKYCGNCKGKGEKVCIACSGSGGKRCSSCNGSGKKSWGTYILSCTNCTGTGLKQCIACSNKGVSVCVTCYGRGEYQCYCEGTGKMLLAKTNHEEVNHAIDSLENDLTYGLKQAEIDSKILAGFQFSNKPTEKELDSVYYISYSRYYSKETKPTAFIELYMMNRYNDGTYPLLSDVYEKIKFQPIVSSNVTRRFLGFFKNLNEAKAAIKLINERGAQQQIDVKEKKEPKRINPPTSPTRNNDDFWKN